MIVAIMLLLSFNSSAQKKNIVDSLESLDLGNYHDTVACKVLNQLAQSHKEYKSRENYAIKLLELSKDKYPIWELRAYLSLGNLRKFNGEYDEALNYYFEGLRIAESVSQRKSGFLYLTIADIYKATQNFKNANTFYKKGLSSYYKSKYLNSTDSTFIAAIYTNQGDMYLKQEMYDSAKYNFENARKLAELLKYEYYLAVIKGNESIVMAALGEDTQAISQLNETIQVLSLRNDWPAATEFLIYMSEIYLKRDNVDLAKEFALKTYEMSKEHGLKDRLEKTSFTLFEIYQRKGDYKKALEYHKEYSVYKDSVLNLETVQKMADQRTEFEVGQKQTELDLVSAQKKTQEIILYAVVGGALLLLALIVVIYRNSLEKNRINKILEDQKTQLEDLNHTKDKLFSIISHDLRSPVHAFAGIGQLIKFAVEDNSHEELLEISEHVEKTSKDLSDLLDGLLSWALQQQGNFKYEPEKINCKSIADDISGVFLYASKSKNIKLTSNIDESLNVWVDKNMTYTIIRNLVNNALKFTKEGGEVGMSASAEGEYVKFSVTDNGIGIPVDKLNSLFKSDGSKASYGTAGEKGLGLGLQLVYEFVSMNNGTVEVESEEGKGTTFIVSLPKYKN